MEKKKFSVRKRYSFYKIVLWISTLVALVSLVLDGVLANLLPWVGLGIVVLAIVFRNTMVRCPHCGHLLTESKTIPDCCPECKEALD